MPIQPPLLRQLNMACSNGRFVLIPLAQRCKYKSPFTTRARKLLCATCRLQVCKHGQTGGLHMCKHGQTPDASMWKRGATEPSIVNEPCPNRSVCSQVARKLALHRKKEHAPRPLAATSFGFNVFFNPKVEKNHPHTSERISEKMLLTITDDP